MGKPPLLCAPKSQVEAMDPAALQSLLAQAQSDFFVCEGSDLASKNCRTRFEWQPADIEIIGPGSPIRTPARFGDEDALCLVQKSGKILTEAEGEALASLLEQAGLTPLLYPDLQLEMGSTFLAEACEIPLPAPTPPPAAGTGGDGCSPEEKLAWLQQVCGTIPTEPTDPSLKGRDQATDEYWDFLQTNFSDSPLNREGNRRSFAIQGLKTTCAFLASKTVPNHSPFLTLPGKGGNGEYPSHTE